MAKSLLLAFAFLYIRHFIAFSPPLFPWTPHEPSGKAHKTLDISFAIFFSCLHFMTFSLALRGRYKREEFPLDFPHALTFYFSPPYPLQNWQHLRNAIFPFGWQVQNFCLLRFFCSCWLFLYHSRFSPPLYSLFSIFLIPLAVALHFPVLRRPAGFMLRPGSLRRPHP